MKVSAIALIAAVVAAALLGTTGVSAAKAPEITDKEFDAIRYNKEKCLIVLFHADWSYASRTLKAEMDELATHFDERSNFSEVSVAMVNGHKFRSLARREDVYVIPMMMFYMWGGDPKPAPGHDAPSIIEHVESILTNDAKHRMIQQELQAEHDRKNIPHPAPGTAVEFSSKEQFDEQMLDISKLVFVLFHAHWCSACKEVLPLMNELAEYFKEDPKVVIGKVECEKHKELCQQYQIDGYPTFMLFGKNREMKEGFKYRGEREATHLKQWLDVHNNVIVDHNPEQSRHQRELALQEEEFRRANPPKAHQYGEHRSGEDHPSQRYKDPH
jgi:protein disulfide-isomerase-like protein